MVRKEGKAVLAYWKHQADQRVVISATQVPHMIRSILAQCLDLDQGRVRVISPDVGGAFGYKCVLQQEALCVAWLAKTYKRPFSLLAADRKSVAEGKSVSVRVDLGGLSNIKKKHTYKRADGTKEKRKKL